MKLIAEGQHQAIPQPGTNILRYSLQHGSGFQYESGKCYSTQIRARPELGNDMPKYYITTNCQLLSWPGVTIL